jgi:hypothetical protein
MGIPSTNEEKERLVVFMLEPVSVLLTVMELVVSVLPNDWIEDSVSVIMDEDPRILMARIGII